MPENTKHISMTCSPVNIYNNGKQPVITINIKISNHDSWSRCDIKGSGTLNIHNFILLGVITFEFFSHKIDFIHCVTMIFLLKSMLLTVLFSDILFIFTFFRAFFFSLCWKTLL